MMVSPSVAADENWKVAESRFCSLGDHLSAFNNFGDASYGEPASPEVERGGRAALPFAELGNTQAGLGMLPRQRMPTFSDSGIRAAGHRVLQANGEKPTSLPPALRWIPRALTAWFWFPS